MANKLDDAEAKGRILESTAKNSDNADSKLSGITLPQIKVQEVPEDWSEKEKKIYLILQAETLVTPNDTSILSAMVRFNNENYREEMLKFDFEDWNVQFRDNKPLARALSNITKFPQIEMKDVENWSEKEKKIYLILQGQSMLTPNDKSIQYVIGSFNNENYREQMLKFDFEDWNGQFRDNEHQSLARALSNITTFPQIEMKDVENWSEEEKKIYLTLQELSMLTPNDKSIQYVISSFNVKNYREQMLKFNFDDWNDQFGDNKHRGIARTLTKLTSPPKQPPKQEDPYEWVDRCPYNLFYKRVKKEEKHQKNQSKIMNIKNHIDNQIRKL